MMECLEIRSKFRVFVAKRIEAMRTSSDHLLYAVLLERIDILLGQGFEEKLVPDAPGCVSCAFLVAPKN